MKISSLVNEVMARHRARLSPVSDACQAQGAEPAQSELTIPALKELPSLIHALRAPTVPVATEAPLQTLIGMVLDESGSMHAGRQQTIDGYNDQLTTIRASAVDIGCRVLQVNFSSSASVIAEDAPVDGLCPLTLATYTPNGNTALYDTVAAVVKKVLSHRLAQDDNTSVLLTITTDGDDTSSLVWKTPDMTEFRQLMKAVSENGRWTVALAGPDTKLREFADLMCVDRGNVAAFTPESLASRSDLMFSSMQAMSGYVASRASGVRRWDVLYADSVSGRRARAILDQKGQR
jgi:hypothetical protein